MPLKKFWCVFVLFCDVYSKKAKKQFLRIASKVEAVRFLYKSLFAKKKKFKIFMIIICVILIYLN